VNQFIINQATKILANGGIIAYPTDTLFGIGCDALNEKAIKRVFEIKSRSFSKPMSIAVSNIKMLEQYVTITEETKSLLQKILPGPYTMLLPKKDLISNLVTAGSDLIGVRIPDYDLILEIIEKFGKPIITTSANLSGEKDITKYEDITLPVDYIIQGKCKYDEPSTVFDPINKKILRRGVNAEKIDQLLKGEHYH
jgi:L-threonylcarbamoyladenylate synthase